MSNAAQSNGAASRLASIAQAAGVSPASRPAGVTHGSDLPPLRCATAGSVDDGKSTLLGRLLFDAKVLMTDQLAHVEEASKRRGLARTDLALVTDGLRAEREQGITIDVAWRYFATPARRFVLADAPGHVQYTRNMVTATSGADVAILLVDARHGLVEQTRRHLFVTHLLGVRAIAVAVNKMDQVGYRHEVFARIRDEIVAYAAGLGLAKSAAETTFFPISALVGDNVVTPSTAMSWYDGPTLLHYLETLPTAVADASAPARFSVQWVIRPQSEAYPDYRGYAGRVVSGVLRKGDVVAAWPSGLASKVSRIETYDGELEQAAAGASVTVHLENDIDLGRGDLLSVRGQTEPRLTKELSVDVAWLHPTPARVGTTYLLRQGAREVRAILDAVDYGYDIAEGQHLAADTFELGMNAVARVRLRTAEPVAVDPYAELRGTGNLVLIDRASGATLAAGMVR